MVYAEPVPVPLREARRRWAELLRRIFEVDPLQCPRCGGAMRIVAFITAARVIDRIVEHLQRAADDRSRGTAPVPRPREPGGFALRSVPVPPRERSCTGIPGSWVRAYLGYPAVPRTDPQAGKQAEQWYESSRTRRGVVLNQ